MLDHAVLKLAGPGQRTVGDHLIALRRGDGQRPGCLETRLVEGGHHAARIDGFHLGGEIGPPVLAGLVEAGETEIVRRAIFDHERGLARGDRFGEVDL